MRPAESQPRRRRLPLVGLQCIVKFSMVMAMKAAQLITNRFSNPPSIMTAETQVLGATAAEWEEAWTAGFRHTFQEIEERTRQTHFPSKADTLTRG